MMSTTASSTKQLASEASSAELIISTGTQTIAHTPLRVSQLTCPDTSEVYTTGTSLETFPLQPPSETMIKYNLGLNQDSLSSGSGKLTGVKATTCQLGTISSKRLNRPQDTSSTSPSSMTIATSLLRTSHLRLSSQRAQLTSR